MPGRKRRRKTGSFLIFSIFTPPELFLNGLGCLLCNLAGLLDGVSTNSKQDKARDVYPEHKSQEDKRTMARNIYHVTPGGERSAKKARLAKILSVPERTIRDWLSRIDKDAKVERNNRIFEAWMQCYTQEEIAERESLTQQAVDKILQEMAILPEVVKPTALHLTDFTPPLFNVWKFKQKSEG